MKESIFGQEVTERILEVMLAKVVFGPIQVYAKTLSKNSIINHWKRRKKLMIAGQKWAVWKSTLLELNIWLLACQKGPSLIAGFAKEQFAMILLKEQRCGLP